MKTNPEPLVKGAEKNAGDASENKAEPITSELNTLIQRPRSPQIKHAPEKVDGIALGTLIAFADNGDALVNIDYFGFKNLSAQTLVELNHSHLTLQVALGFQAGNPYRPIVLGLLHQAKNEKEAIAHEIQPSQQELVITQQGKRITIEAEQELELRCGEAVILLTADGHIQLRGGYITSHADATQRIRGGSVQIN